VNTPVPEQRVIPRAMTFGKAPIKSIGGARAPRKRLATKCARKFNYGGKMARTTGFGFAQTASVSNSI